MLIDCHSHLASADFDGDLPQVLARAGEVGVAAILVVGEDLEDNRRVEEKTSDRTSNAALPLLAPCYGFHPDRFADEAPLPTQDSLAEVLQSLRDRAPEMVALGEVGLDRWVTQEEERRGLQEDFFREVVKLARDHQLTLNIHSRSAGRRTLELLEELEAPRVLMHAFDGKAGHALRFVDRGWIFSIPPSLVRSPQKQKLVRALPLESLALESDSPVLGPEPQVRNEPANLALARDWIAELKGVTPEEVEEVTTRNALQLFPRVGARLQGQRVDSARESA